jgi:hypothetical protein
MQPRKTSCAFVVLAALAGGGAVAAQDTQKHQWATYHNARFGTTAEYPADIFTVRDPPPTNSDGRTFHTADGHARLLIYGMRNFEQDSPSSYVEKYFNKPEVTYKRTKWPFFVVSGVRDGEIFYDRCNFPIVADGIVDCIELRYPAKNKAEWDPIVERISKSLRAGKGFQRQE